MRAPSPRSSKGQRRTPRPSELPRTQRELPDCSQNKPPQSQLAAPGVRASIPPQKAETIDRACSQPESAATPTGFPRCTFGNFPILPAPTQTATNRCAHALPCAALYRREPLCRTLWPHSGRPDGSPTKIGWCPVSGAACRQPFSRRGRPLHPNDSREGAPPAKEPARRTAEIGAGQEGAPSTELLRDRLPGVPLCSSTAAPLLCVMFSSIAS